MKTASALALTATYLAFAFLIRELFVEVVWFVGTALHDYFYSIYGGKS